MSYEHAEKEGACRIPGSKQISLVGFPILTHAPYDQRHRWGLDDVAQRVRELRLFHFNFEYAHQKTFYEMLLKDVPASERGRILSGLRPTYHLLLDPHPASIQSPKVVEAFRLMGYNPEDSSVYMKQVDLEQMPKVKRVLEANIAGELAQIVSNSKRSSEENLIALEKFLERPHLARKGLLGRL